MKRIILLNLLFLSISVLAQNISISSFKLLDTDLTANTAGTMEMDQNGETSALIKVVTTQTGFTFDGGALGIVKTVQKPSEIWVYVPRGLKKITISHPQLGIIRDYYFPVAIEAARTYEMILVSGEVQTVIKQTSNSQYLVIKVTPSNAFVELNNEILPTSEGVAQKFLKLGTYEYRVQAKDYHTTAGKVTIDDPNNKKMLEVNLKPAFGWIEIPENEEYNGAQVYIDNELIGYSPIKSKNISSGTHSLKISKALYQTYEESVIVEDNKTTFITPKLVADYSTVTLSVDNEAEIYVNEEYKGTGAWTGNLGSGLYIFEAKKKNHRSTKTTYEINSSQKQHRINLEAPTPIYGKLDITSTPTISDVIIDGKPVGQTPIFIPDCLIGEHQIEIKHLGYQSYNSAIIVKENESNNINAILNEYIQVFINCNVSRPTLYLNGKYYGIIDESINLQPDDYTIKLTKEGYIDYSARISVSKERNNFNFKLEKEKKVTKAQTPTTKINWEQVYVTNNQSDIYNKIKVGDVTEKYGIGGAFESLVEKNYQRCIKRMKKKAAKLGATVILLGTPYEVHPLGGNFMKIPATAYK